MIIVGRPINGISINGREYLLGADSKPLEFKSRRIAEEFLMVNGVSKGNLDAFEYVDIEQETSV